MTLAVIEKYQVLAYKREKTKKENKKEKKERKKK